jgi:hypothetical protein
LSIDDLRATHSQSSSSIAAAALAVESPPRDEEHVREGSSAAAGLSGSGMRPAVKAATTPHHDGVAIEVEVGVDSSRAQPPLETPSR